MIILAVWTFDYLTWELRQLWRSGLWDWLSEAWNVFDALQLGLMLSILILHWTCGASMNVLRGGAAEASHTKLWCTT